MRGKYVLLLILCLLLVSCSRKVVEKVEEVEWIGEEVPVEVVSEGEIVPEEQAPPEIVEPAPEVMPEAKVEEPEEAVEEQAAEEEVIKETSLTGDILSIKDTTDEKVIKELSCDDTTGKLSFVVYNPTDRSLDPSRGGIFEDEANLIRLSVNGRRYGGECDTEELKAKETMTCTADFNSNDASTKTVLRFGSNDLGVPMANRLLVQATGVSSVVLFRCRS